MAYFAELSQIGVEMAAPIAAGAVIDYYMGWNHWGAIVGAVLGLVGGIFHLVKISNRPPADLESADRDDKGPQGTR